MATAIPALITGGANLVGGAIGSVGSKHAANLQAKATEEALAFQKQQYADSQRQYAEQQAQAKAAWDAYQTQMQPFRNIAAQTLAKYGYKGALNTLGDYGAAPKSGLGMAPAGAYGSPRAQTGMQPQGADVRALGGGRSLEDIYRELQIQNPNAMSDLAYNQNQRQF